jgi:hypothetical protein
MKSSSENATVVVGTLGNMNFNYIVDSLGFADGDSVGPAIAIYGDPYYKEAKLGEEYVVSAAKAFDFVSGETEVFATVKKNGVKIVTNRSVSEPFTIALYDYGLFSVEYVAKDSNGKSTTRTITIEVVDDVFPTVEVNGTYKTDVKKGEKIKIHDFVASDEQGEVQTTIYLRAPDLTYTIVAVGDTIALTDKGVYMLVYSAKDESGNVTRKTVYVNVN